MRELEMQQENDETKVLEWLIENGEPDGKALGIAKQFMDPEARPLTDRQRAVFNRDIANKYFKMTCSLCRIPMPTNKVAYALAAGDGYCGHCRGAVSNSD